MKRQPWSKKDYLNGAVMTEEAAQEMRNQIRKDRILKYAWVIVNIVAVFAFIWRL